MTKKKEVAPEPASREELEALAKEVNAVLNLDAPIKFGKKVTDDDLEAAIIKECAGNVYEIDFIEDAEDDTIPVYSEESKEIFALLGIDILPGSPEDAAKEEAPAPAKGKGKAKEEAPEPKPTGKGKGAKEEAPAPAAKKKDTPAKAKAKDEPRYTRSDAWKDAVEATAKKPLTKEELIVACDAVFVKNGGVKTSNSTNYFKYLIAPFVTFGILEVGADKKLKYVP